MLIALVVVAALSIASLGWHAAYRTGVRHGRMAQSLDDRHEIEQAVIAKARAEQLAETWAKRARALLFAHFGPEGKP